MIKAESSSSETEKPNMATTTNKPALPKEPAASSNNDESRNDKSNERDSSNTVDAAPSSKRASKNKSKSASNAQNRRYPPDRYPYPPGRGPYPGPGMYGGPRGPPPPYGHPGSGGPPPPDHYRVPPHHYHHQMPPMPHQGGPYGGPTGPYGPPPSGMGGRHGGPGPGSGPSYHPYYMGGPHMPYHGVPPFPNQNPPPMPGGPSDNNSISSTKSKGSTTDKKSSKSSQASKSSGMRKKRTIDGVHDGQSHHHHHLHHQDLPASAYSFRRTESNASSSSTVTASNNTHSVSHSEGHHGEGSPHIKHRASELPPLPHPSHNASMDDSKTKSLHRRAHSGASTASSLSVGGFSLSSYEGHRVHGMDHIEDIPMLKQSPKRRKGADAKPLVVDTGEDARHRRLPSASSPSIDGAESSRFEQLSMEDSKPAATSSSQSGDDNGASLFLSLSTSPINHPADVDATPISKNTKKNAPASASTAKKPSAQPRHNPFKIHPLASRKHDPTSKSQSMIDHRPVDTPTPPIPNSMSGNEMMTEEHMLNRHLRIQSFTPVSHMGAGGGESTASAAESPSNMGAFGSLAPQLSWSIAGDTPSLGDLAEWEEHVAHAKGEEKSRPNSTTSSHSNTSRNMIISPHSFAMWAEDDHGHKNGDSMRLSIMTPHSDMGMMIDGTLSGTTTPLPIFFDQPSSEERENRTDQQRPRSSSTSRKMHQQPHQHGDPEHIHHMFVSNGGRGGDKGSQQKPGMHHFWGKNEHGLPTPVGSTIDKDGFAVPMGLPPTPLYAASEFGRDEGFVRSPMHGGDRHRDGHSDFFPSNAMYGHPGSHERVRNLRGRVHPGGHHMAPMPLHIPPPMSSQLPLTSPMGIGHKAGMWSPHHGGMPPPLASPLHMSPMNMSQSKRKCVPLKPPIPSKYQGDIDKYKSAQVPEFTSLVNFPAHMSQKQAVNLPDGMRCCVMCGQACPCSSGNKNKKGTKGGGSKGSDGSLAPRNSNGQDMMGDKGGYAIIPTQNKGLCTLCDVNVWVVVSSGLEIKWCKGCKNFRPWAAFGDKGLATKCLRCRERQREKYALQKEEKEKSRLVAKAGKK